MDDVEISPDGECRDHWEAPAVSEAFVEELCAQGWDLLFRRLWALELPDELVNLAWNLSFLEFYLLQAARHGRVDPDTNGAAAGVVIELLNAFGR